MKRSLVTLVAFFAVALLGSGAGARAAELQPLSPQDAARAQQLLSSFDPSTYEFLYNHVDATGVVKHGRLGSAVGLGNVRQEGTVKQQPGGGSVHITGINIFKNAILISSVNVFKVAATSENPCGGRWFKNPAEQAKANELNSLLQKYYH